MDRVKELNRIRAKRYYDNNKDKILFKRKNKTKVENIIETNVEKVEDKVENIIETNVEKVEDKVENIIETNVPKVETNKKLIHYKMLYMRMLNNMNPQQKLTFVSTKNQNENDEMYELKKSLL
jgi:hypothetical protein